MLGKESIFFTLYSYTFKYQGNGGKSPYFLLRNVPYPIAKLCSVSCEYGIRSRPVTCVDKVTGKRLGFNECDDERPRNTKRCYKGHCPQWKAGPWGKCSVNCGTGEQKRQIKCVDKRNRPIDPIYCPPKNNSIITTMSCSRNDCSLYVWKKGSWSECSRTCGFGRKHRSVTCVDRSNVHVSSHLCDNNKRPKIKRRCSEFPCPYIWNTGPWSECSATCGEGQQQRNVTCQAVTPEGWILPGEISYGCRQEERPSQNRYCNYGHCAASNHWSIGPWGQCNVPCGYGRQRRQVICRDKHGKRTRRHHCYSLFRPVTRRRCFSRNCYARSCLELRNMTKIKKDGDYRLRVNDSLVTIYCRAMRTRYPKEYISLTSSVNENYSEIFGKRLQRPKTCPYEGERPQYDCDMCRKKDYRQAKNATYAKIRVNLSTLTVITTDKFFSTQSHGRRKSIHYASAGDCYSGIDCPQGRFSINLVGTGFAVSGNSTWKNKGKNVTQRIWRLKGGQIIRGMCGGLCGRCYPDPSTGLQLVLVK
ncbi:A disintegrin and metalloproteinase with thrombospondin motifs 9 [Plakobranchus ocellatus]|uniref:A disintegrin and metalloproteinase with thrombospondin motifs 9 n=1 Tax=Plakobranchus ocellatus TaxID=259542 RepID=A0AAV3YP43_9GAST|nr:A disintegrin and metalloproteinase with thrombospondin motifs 9 [Plakobranchus ocellatus]